MRRKMNKLFVSLTVAALTTILVSINTHARHQAFDGKGNLFVADYSGTISKYTPDGTKSTFASGVTPDELIFDHSGNLFGLDRGDGAIFKFTPDGKKSTFASQLVPHAVALDSAGNLFVADDANRSILKFTPDGNKSTFASHLGASDRGYDLVFDAANNLFVVDSGSKSIFKFAPDGTKSTFATGDFIRPIFDKAGNLYVLESGSILKFTSDGARSTFAVVSEHTSPDKKWEYVGGDEQKLVKSGTNEMALDLSDHVLGGGIWAPDSKRFALNWGRGRSHNTELYQLRGNKWKTLKSPDDDVHEILNKAIAAQVKKSGLPKKTDLRFIGERFEVTHWVDSNTAILYAWLEEMFRETLDPDFTVNFLFTLKFDDAGKWKIVKTQRVSDEEEIGEEDARKDISGPTQTTEQEELRADASFRDADRRLNEVYNSLRARLSPSERDRLKKEQLAWIDRRNAAAQAAKANAQEIPTEVADREVTEMTLARAAELEKRLKKVK